MSGLPGAAARLIVPNRKQLILDIIDVEKLIADDHPARAIWEFVGGLNLQPYKSAIKSVEGEAGRPAYDPHLLLSLWIFATSDGEGSAREIERLCTHHPAYRWLTGLQVINYHTLSNFRIAHKEKLDELFTQILGVLSSENLITLQRVTQDGTKIRACASSNSFRREGTLRNHLELAKKQVADMGDPRERVGSKRALALARGARERKARLEKALEELEKLRAVKKGVEGRRNARISKTDPEARIMRQSGSGGFAPSYNVQLSVDSARDIIVNVDVSQSPTDGKELVGPMEKVEERMGKKPKQVVADGQYTNYANIMSMANSKIDFIGSIPLDNTSSLIDMYYKRRGITAKFFNTAFRYDKVADKYVCPAGKDLPLVSTSTQRPGVIQYNYQVSGRICAGCPNRKGCLPSLENRVIKDIGRTITRRVDLPPIVAFHKKMETAEAKAAYRSRSQTAEFPNAWIKQKFGLRQFCTRGKAKTYQEALWACVTYNIQQWIRLIWLPQLAASSG